MTDKQMLDEHVAALFVLDGDKRLVAVNEPWSKAKPAPLIYVGRTLDQALALYVREDIKHDVYEQVSLLFQRKVFDARLYACVVGGRQFSEEICYSVPIQSTPLENCVAVCRNSVDAYDLREFPWLIDEIDTAQPCSAYVQDCKAVSVCRSVRIANVHEAGIETAPPYRGRGYANEVLSAWSRQVTDMGMIPLYSTSKTNLASQRVAAKSGLRLFAEAFHINA